MSSPGWMETLKLAINIIKNVAIPQNCWSFGGGTALMRGYNHRLSKDIDIFLNDPQLLNYFHPSLNDDVYAIAKSYESCANFVKIHLGSTDIDFIISKNISPLQPKLDKIDGMEIYIDDPVEIIMKKIYYRGSSFTQRDIFDLATVFYYDGARLLEHAKELDSDIIDAFTKRISCVLETGSELNVRRLPGSVPYTGQEFALCTDFLEELCRCDLRPGMY